MPNPEKGYTQLPNKMKQQQQQQQPPQTNHRKRKTQTQKLKKTQTTPPSKPSSIDFWTADSKNPFSRPGSSLVPSISQGSSICIPHLLHRSAPFGSMVVSGNLLKGRYILPIGWLYITYTTYEGNQKPPLIWGLFWFGFFAGFLSVVNLQRWSEVECENKNTNSKLKSTEWWLLLKS